MRSSAFMVLPVLMVPVVVACGGNSARVGAGPSAADAGAGGGAVDAGTSPADAAADAGTGGGAMDAGGSAVDGGGGGCTASVASSPGLVLTDRGPVQGAVAAGAWAYQGIPYAAPPTGALRWTPPTQHACWSAPLATTSFAAKRLQVDPSQTTSVIGQEDCLTANVWSPTTATPASKLPVLVFIHGGGNVQGSSADTDANGYIYDGAALAAHANAIVVTFNYRLGALGFLAHPSFGAQPGNYGTLDQISALAWVQRNATAFGGDPTHVLLFGQSAGAVDVCDMIASPLAKGLFSAAIMESGGCTAKSPTDAQSFAQTWAAKAGCGSASDPASCLRALDASAVTLVLPEPADIAGGKKGDYQPNVDGVALTGVPDAVIRSGSHNHVPLVVGSNSDETSLELAKANPGGMTAADYQAAVLSYAGGTPTLANQIRHHLSGVGASRPARVPTFKSATGAKFYQHGDDVRRLRGGQGSTRDAGVEVLLRTPTRRRDRPAESPRRVARRRARARLPGARLGGVRAERRGRGPHERHRWGMGRYGGLGERARGGRDVADLRSEHRPVHEYRRCSNARVGSAHEPGRLLERHPPAECSP